MNGTVICNLIVSCVYYRVTGLLMDFIASLLVAALLPVGMLNSTIGSSFVRARDNIGYS